MPGSPLPQQPPVRPESLWMTMLTFDLLADLQKGSGSNIGLPKRIGQMTFSSSSVAAVHCAFVIVPDGACHGEARALWCTTSGSPVVEPGSHPRAGDAFCRRGCRRRAAGRPRSSSTNPDRTRRRPRSLRRSRRCSTRHQNRYPTRRPPWGHLWRLEGRLLRSDPPTRWTPRLRSSSCPRYTRRSSGVPPLEALAPVPAAVPAAPPSSGSGAGPFVPPPEHATFASSANPASTGWRMGFALIAPHSDGARSAMGQQSLRDSTRGARHSTYGSARRDRRPRLR